MELAVLDQPMAQSPATNNLTRKCLLVRLKISLWEGVIQDKSVQSTVATTYNVQSKGDVIAKKRLMGLALKPIQTKAQQLRTLWEEGTLPWEDDGTRIATSVGVWRLLPRLQLAKDELLGMFDQFTQEYPMLLRERQWALGDLWHEDDYPKPEVVRGKFDVKISVRPLPERGDFRVAMSPEEMEWAQKQLEDSLMDGIKSAQAHTWGRLKEGLERMRNRLTLYQGPGTGRTGSFKDSLVENLKEIVDNLPELNLAEDPALEQLCKEVGERCIVEPERLREDAEKRIEVRDAADELLQRIGGLFTQ